jgi:antitoxin HicB
MRFLYPVDISGHVSTGDDGRPVTEYLATFPDLPEAITSGDTHAEALVNAVDCLEEALAARIKAREDLPAPGPARVGVGAPRPLIAPGSLIASKAALYLALRESGLRPAELARRAGIDRAAVNRLLDPAHATKPAQFDAAFAALGKRLVVSVENAA